MIVSRQNQEVEHFVNESMDRVDVRVCGTFLSAFLLLVNNISSVYYRSPSSFFDL